MTRAWATLALIATLVGCTTQPKISPVPRSPTNVTAETGTDYVVLTWSVPNGVGAPISSFKIYRNGNLVQSVPGSARTFKDSGLTPATKYYYRIEAVAGGKSAPSETIIVKTVTPPLNQALLLGDFRVLYTVSSSNLGNAHPGQPLGRYTWTFKPKCSLGACKGTWVEHFKSGGMARGQYLPLAGRYTGRMSHADLGSCGGINDTNVSATLVFRVTKAAVKDGVWRAVLFEGKLREYYPGEHGCISGYLQADVIGQFKPA